jgi:hypothetical protein
VVSKSSFSSIKPASIKGKLGLISLQTPRFKKNNQKIFKTNFYLKKCSGKKNSFFLGISLQAPTSEGIFLKLPTIHIN